MSPHRLDTLRQDLLEYAFGCHEDPTAIERRMAAEPEVAALFAEVQATARLLGAAAKSPAPALELKRPAPASQRPIPWWAAAGVAAAVLLPALVWGWETHRLEQVIEKTLRIVVSGPPATVDGAEARFRVETWDADQAPRTADVQWRVLDADGRELASEARSISGAADFTLAPELRTARHVVVEARAGETVAEATLDLQPGGGSPLVHLTTDKPAYRPGEPVYLRGVFLDRLSLAPRDRRYRLRIVDAKGAAITELNNNANNGVIGATWFVPAAVGGTCAFELRSAANDLTLARCEFLVRSYQPPKLAKTIALDRASYAPGTTGRASLSVIRADGAPAATATAEATVVIDGVATWSTSLALDARGEAGFSFDVAKSVERGDARLVVRVADQGLVETAVEPFLVPTGRLEVGLHPEGGDLVPGVEARVYVEVRDSLGRAVDTTGVVVDDLGRQVATIATVHQGRTRFSITPAAERRYRLELADAGATSVALPAPVAGGAILAARATSFLADEPLGIRVVTPDPGPWAVGVFCRGALVGQDSFQGAGARELDITLRDGVAGVLRVTLFDHRLRPVAERLVHRVSTQRLAVDLAPAHASLAPGGKQEVRVVVRDEVGRPVRAVVGLTVTDRAVRDLVGSHRIGLEDAASLTADVDDLEDVEAFLGTGPDFAERIDLLLGTRGWRRFAWSKPADVVAARGDAGRRLLAREGGAAPPVVADVQGPMSGRELGRARSQSERSRGVVLGLVAVAAVLAGLGLVFRALWRIGARPETRWVRPVFVVAPIALVALGMVAVQTRTLGPDGAFVERAFLGGAAPAAEVGAEVWDAAGEVERGTGAEWPEPALVLADEEFEEVDIPDADDAIAKGVAVADDELAQDLVDARLERRWKRADGLEWARVYAHVRGGDRSRRTDFRETVYWNAALMTDERGAASASFDLSDSATTWDVWVDAHGDGRVGQAHASFTARLPLRIEAKLPPECTKGDRLRLPIAVIASDPALAEVELEIELRGGLALEGSDHLTVALTGGAARSVIDVAVREVGAAQVRVVARSGAWTDEVEHTVRVVPRGFPHHVSRSGVVRGSESFDVAIPAATTGRLTAVLKAFPSPLATLQDGLDGMLREPHGCFEQASSANYPNVLMLALLDHSTGASPATVARARAFLDQGYTKLTGYECSKQGYEWFGSDPGHESLTAYGLLEFHDMARVYDVDRAMIERTQSWLLARRDGRGGYRPNGRQLDSFGGAPAEVTDSYVTYALAATGTDRESIARELDRVQELAIASDDPYVVAVAACALAETGRPAVADQARERLKTMQRPDGSLLGLSTSITSSRGRDLTVETTGFAVLAWSFDDEDRAPLTRAIEYILGCRERGTFGATQATIMALKAILVGAEKVRQIPEGRLLAYVDDRLVGQAELDPRTGGAIVFSNLGEGLRPGVATIRLEIDGAGEVPWSFDLTYFAERPASDPETSVGITVESSDAPLREGDTVAIELGVHDRSGGGLPMTLAIVGLPAGLDVPTAVLDDLRGAGRFDLWELRGRELTLYWRGIAPGATRRVTIDCVARVPGRSVGPASRAYLYYSPGQKDWARPLEVTIAD